MGLNVWAYIQEGTEFSQEWLSGKESACSAADVCSIPGLERSPGEWNGNPLQYSCLGNPMDREAWQATVQGILKESDTIEQLNNKTTKEHTADMWLLYGHFYVGCQLWKPLLRVLKWYWSGVSPLLLAETKQ